MRKVEHIVLGPASAEMGMGVGAEPFRLPAPLPGWRMASSEACAEQEWAVGQAQPWYWEGGRERLPGKGLLLVSAHMTKCDRQLEFCFLRSYTRSRTSPEASKTVVVHWCTRWGGPELENP